MWGYVYGDGIVFTGKKNSSWNTEAEHQFILFDDNGTVANPAVAKTFNKRLTSLASVKLTNVSSWEPAVAMPTKAEWENLFKSNTFKWTDSGGSYGFYKTSGNYLFLSATGWKEGTSWYNNAYNAHYWSSTYIGFSSCHNAYFVKLGRSTNNSCSVSFGDTWGRDGRAVRAIHL